MTGFEGYVRRPRAALLLFLAVTLACQAPQPSGSIASSGTSSTTSDVPRTTEAPRDLSQDESAGGHTLRKHVGRSDDELRQRLRRERNISAASTWIDRSTAESAGGDALQRNREPIDRWLGRSGSHPNFVIDYDS